MSEYTGKVIEGRYKIQEMIGRGGMANVYLVYDQVGKRELAMKILKPEFAENEELVRRFKNESKAIALLSHSGIIKVYDLCFTEEIKCIVMEYVKGITLKDYLESQGCLKGQEICFFEKQILKAVGHAHQKGVVHRDLKPQNVLLTEQGQLKISDFGIARFARHESKTLSNKTIGTVGYVSPEQASGGKSDGRSDIYSIGVMLYEMATGQLPFSGETPVSVAIKHIEEFPVPPMEINPAIPIGLQEIILKAMAKNPDNRYQTCEEMQEDFEQFRENPQIVFGYNTLEKEKKDSITMKKNEEKDVDEAPKKKAKEPREKGSSVIPVLTGITAAFVVVTILFIATMFYLYNPFTPVENIEVPNLVGLGYEAVKEQSIYSQLDIVVEETQYNDVYGEGVIYYQSPKSGIDVKVGATVKVKVSRGQKVVEVPQLVGAEETVAYQMLVDNDLRYSKVSVNSTTMPAGYVIASEPGAGSAISAGTEVKLTVSLGPTSSFVVVPDLRNMTRDEAQVVLEGMGLSLGGVSYVEDDSVEDGKILAQDPVANSEIGMGGYVNINVVGSASTTNSISLNVKMPDMDELCDISIMINGTIIHSERVSPKDVGYWSPTLTGSGIKEAYILIDGQLYQLYELNFMAGMASLREDNSSDF